MMRDKKKTKTEDLNEKLDFKELGEEMLKFFKSKNNKQILKQSSREQITKDALLNLRNNCHFCRVLFFPSSNKWFVILV
jgi:hypothetical protein